MSCDNDITTIVYSIVQINHVNKFFVSKLKNENAYQRLTSRHVQQRCVYGTRVLFVGLSYYLDMFIGKHYTMKELDNSYITLFTDNINIL